MLRAVEVVSNAVVTFLVNQYVLVMSSKNEHDDEPDTSKEDPSTPEQVAPPLPKIDEKKAAERKVTSSFCACCCSLVCFRCTMSC